MKSSSAKRNPFAAHSTPGVPEPDDVLRGKTALVTGATSPIGRAICLALADRGVHIALHYFEARKEAIRLQRELRGRGLRSEVFKADFGSKKGAESLSRQVRSRMGRIDLLINNASVYPAEKTSEPAPGGFNKTMRINARSPEALCVLFKSQAGTGAIVNILDSRIVGGDPQHAGYIITKSLLELFTRRMALAFAPKVRVNAVAPGLIDSKSSGNRIPSLPLQQAGTPNDIAQAVLYLLSAAFVTGQVLFVDGGRQARELLGGHTQ